jgi:hypothetical protein
MQESLEQSISESGDVCATAGAPEPRGRTVGRLGEDISPTILEEAPEELDAIKHVLNA